MAKLLNFKKILRSQPPERSYKYTHYLNSLSREKLAEIFLYSESDHISNLITGLKNKNVVLFNDQNHKYLLKKILPEDPKFVLNYVYKGHTVKEQKEGYFSVLGGTESLAIRPNYYDVVLCPFVLEDFYFFEDFISKLGPKLRNNSRLILGLRHPYMDHMIYNQNPLENRVSENLISKIFQCLQKNHFFTETIHEGCVDLSLKPFFKEEEGGSYHEYKNTPITLFFKAVKFAPKTGS